MKEVVFFSGSRFQQQLKGLIIYTHINIHEVVFLNYRHSPGFLLLYNTFF